VIHVSGFDLDAPMLSDASDPSNLSDPSDLFISAARPPQFNSGLCVLALI
jgi:hypothetical protein